MANGQWPMAMANGHWPWPMAMANGHGQWLEGRPWLALRTNTANKTVGYALPNGRPWLAWQAAVTNLTVGHGLPDGVWQPTAKL